MSTTTEEKKKTHKPAEVWGMVVSDKMDKTCVVKLSTRKMHPLYKKFVASSKKVKAHDEKNEAGVGDQVLLVESKPLSKTKRYALKKVLRKAKL